MTLDLPKAVQGWPLARRVDWILRQPHGLDVARGRLLALIRQEKDASAEIASSLFVCSFEEER